MADANGEPLRLWNWRELFVDHHLIDRLEGASLKLHEPRPAGTAIDYDRPWEGRGSAYMTVLEDDGVYRLYYRGAPGDGPQVTCYAESADGVEWTKPDLGLFDVAGTRNNNVILTPETGGDATHNFSPMVDKRPGVPESEQYKALGGSGRGGLTAFASADAITQSRGGSSSKSLSSRKGRSTPRTCASGRGQRACTCATSGYSLTASARSPGRLPRTSAPGRSRSR